MKKMKKMQGTDWAAFIRLGDILIKKPQHGIDLPKGLCRYLGNFDDRRWIHYDESSGWKLTEEGLKIYREVSAEQTK